MNAIANGSLLTVVRGCPTPEQVAALVAVVGAAVRSLPAADPAGQDRAASFWAAPALRATPASGPYGWRASMMPH